MKSMITTLATAALLAAVAAAAPLQSFRPGELWPDNNGIHINAHGGGILLHEGTYYWFGEHKIEGVAGNTAQVGVHVYSSKDLYHWKDEGIALRVSEDPKSDITKGCILERPKVIFNARTGKFVMWFHLELVGQGYRAARSGVAVADKVTGPFTFVESFRPNAGVWPENVPDEMKKPLSAEESDKLSKVAMPGDFVPEFARDWVFRRDHAGGQMARDMTLFVDDDGKAYHIYASEENSTLHISLLSDDYLKPAGRFIRIFPLDFNEAPALFKRNGKYFMFASGCTGWSPNPARSAVADSIWGPWKALGNPCVGTEEQMKITFGSQSTFVLPVPGKKDAFLFMGDRWRPENAIDGRYVWLPVQFNRDGRPLLEWKDEWDLSIFDLGPLDGSSAPRPVPGKDAAASRDTVSFRWQSIPGAAGYRIHQNGRLIKVTNRLDFTRSGLAPGIRLAYTVTPVALDGSTGKTSETLVWTTAGGERGDLWLDEIEPLQKTQEWGELGRKTSVSGGPITIASSRYANGLGTHANSHLIYSVPTHAKRLEAWAGVDAGGPNGSIRFQVKCDGVLKFDSGVMRASDAAKHVVIPLDGVFELELLASDTGDGNSHDHANWADARFLSDTRD